MLTDSDIVKEIRTRTTLDPESFSEETVSFITRIIKETDEIGADTLRDLIFMLNSLKVSLSIKKFIAKLFRMSALHTCVRVPIPKEITPENIYRREIDKINDFLFGKKCSLVLSVYHHTEDEYTEIWVAQIGPRTCPLYD